MPMSQNLVSITFTDAQLVAIDQTLDTLESQLLNLVALNADQRRSVPKMGEKSEAFCRQALTLLEQNPQVVPPSVAVADAKADLLALDQWRPRMLRLQRLSERSEDTGLALGSDVMATALQGYALLKVVGKNQGLEGLRKSLGTRFTKSSRQPESKVA
jgi:hypothetical protein